MERFYSLDIKTQYVLQDSVRKDTFKSITTVEGVQWLMWTFYHWGIKYLTYDTVMGLQLFHGRPVYDVNTKRWYGAKVVKTENVEDTGSNTTTSNSISSDSGVQPVVLGTNTREVVEYTDNGNEPRGLSFYLHSLISSVFELSEGTAIELTTQAIEDDLANKLLTDGTIVEVSNNGITWFKRYFKSIEPNLSTKYCVYGGGRTKDTVRDMADVEYYQYMRYTDNKQSNTNTCNNGCGNCNNTTVKFESVRNTVDGRVVFADRGSLNR